MPDGAPLHARVLSGIHEVTSAAWNALLAPSDAPALRWHWLEALESSGSAGAGAGWSPRHVVLFAGPRLVGAVPLYVRASSEGEFVGYPAIEDACQRIGVPFGPRAIATIPFTPIPGRRFLTGPHLDRTEGITLLAGVLRELLVAAELASVNVHFCADDEVAALTAVGWTLRIQWQDRWVRRAGEASFEDVLARFRSKDRIQIRRERRGVAEQGIRVRCVGGDAAPDAWFDAMGRLYTLNAERHADGPPLIQPAFFRRLAEGDARRDVVLVAAEDDAGALRGLALDLRGADALYGRSWGLSRPARYLHFECAYYAGIEFCLQHGLARFEPGHGGDFKLQRGCEPALVSSLHWFADRGLHAAVAAWAKRERAAVAQALAQRRSQLPFKRDGSESGPGGG